MCLEEEKEIVEIRSMERQIQVKISRSRLDQVVTYTILSKLTLVRNEHLAGRRMHVTV